MTKKYKTWILAAIPTITVMLSFYDKAARILGWSDRQWDKTIYNCVMIVLVLIAWLATSLLFRDELETGFWNSGTNSGVRGLTVLLVNLSACLLIFIKNTETWGYTFGWKHPFLDLWGWPLLWLGAALLLLLVQSPAGKAARNGGKFLIQKGKGLFSLLWKFIQWIVDLLSKMGMAIKNCDTCVLLVLFSFIAAFLAFILSRVRIMGARAAIADHWLLFEVAAALFIGICLGGGLLCLFPILLSRLKLLINGQGRSTMGTTMPHSGITVSRKAVLKIFFAALSFGVLPVTILFFSTMQSSNIDFSAGKDIMECITAVLEFIMAMGDSAERFFL